MGIMVCYMYFVCIMKTSLISIAVKERTSTSPCSSTPPLFDLLEISANDVLDLEIEAGGTIFAAGSDSQNAFATLLEGNRWMIFRNTLTGVLHWDFVSFYSSRRVFGD